MPLSIGSGAGTILSPAGFGVVALTEAVGAAAGGATAGGAALVGMVADDVGAVAFGTGVFAGLS